ncbi:protein phosphatase 2C domain-containing protein [Candidatus Parcubacteria bacterium]|nr:protein phosphatase 2C domain-containing protein [Candidatus Parcubacteria bacterium]
MKLEFGMMCGEGGRCHNEDIGAIFTPAMLFVAIDGMGGHEGGEIAAAMVYEGFRALTHQDPGLALLCQTAEAINARMYAMNTESASQDENQGGRYRGMGAVVTAIWFDLDSEVYHLHHVGDTRAYEYIDGRLTLVSDDHSLSCVKALSERERQKHRLKNIVTSSYGAREGFEHMLATTYRIVEGMTILLCSDGLTDYVDPDVMEAIIANDMGAQKKAEALYQSAMDADTCDNVTIIVVHVMPEDRDCKARSNSATLCPIE